MVYHGRSAGCERCRKVKRSCGQERPSCARCLRIKLPCPGYRQEPAFRIRDESRSVALKVLQRQGLSTPGPIPEEKKSSPASVSSERESLGAFPSSSHSFTTRKSMSSVLPPTHKSESVSESPPGDQASPACYSSPELRSLGISLLKTIEPRANDVAMDYFLKTFVAKGSGSWSFLRSYAWHSDLDECLKLTFRACGMAALANLRNVPAGRLYAQTHYATALRLLNNALCNPQLSTTDECLIAVTILGYYETLVSDNVESMQTWKVHIKGAAQILQLRGRAQLQSPLGRHLFRDARAQILITNIWDGEMPPDFLWDWEDELESLSQDLQLVLPPDSMTKISFDIAVLRAKMRRKTIGVVKAAEDAFHLDSRLTSWCIHVTCSDAAWNFRSISVPDSEDVWNGSVHVYSASSTISIWNTLRCLRILVMEILEELGRKLPVSTLNNQFHTHYLRDVRRQLVDEICSSVPCVLGYGGGREQHSCDLISAYGVMWPLFLAGSSALKRVQAEIVQDAYRLPARQQHISAASAQLLWIIGRLEFVSERLGLRWSHGVAEALKDRTGSGGIFSVAEETT